MRQTLDEPYRTISPNEILAGSRSKRLPEFGIMPASCKDPGGPLSVEKQAEGLLAGQ